MRKILFLFTTLLPCALFGQMVSTSVFLQGQFLEIGMNPNGSFGTDYSVSAPSGYHPHCYSGSNLAEVYDLNHDGWTSGTPAYMGDYTLPGTPYEGWEIQVSGTKYSAVATAVNVITNGGTGGIVSYQNFGGTAMANWSGAVAGGDLQINSTTQVDTFASWVLVKVNLTNVGSSPLTDIYYIRTCDPDNNVTWSGGTYSPGCAVTYQNDNRHRVLASTTTWSPYSYFGLGAKDVRAGACFIVTWPIASTTDLSTIYIPPAAGSGGASDIAMGLLFNIGTLNSGAHTSFSYAYIFSGPVYIDSIFPVTILSRNDSFEVDTTRFCHGPEMTNYSAHFYPGSMIKTYYGDGTWDTASMFPGYGRGTTSFNHNYAISGTYTIKQVFYIGSVPVDSIHFSYHNVRCTGIPIRFYVNKDSNCTMDSNEVYLKRSIRVEVDSNTVPIDTIVCSNGFYYDALGPAGDVYQFRLLPSDTFFVPACPLSGIVSDTIISSVYCTPTHYVGLNCNSGSAYDLSIIPSVEGCGVHAQTGNIYPFQDLCPSVNGTVTMTHSPQYGYFSATPAPSAITGNNISWDFSGLTDSSRPHIYYHLEMSSSLLTIGDTVISKFVIDPIAGDYDTTDNSEIIVDTVRAGFDPNCIHVSPAANIISGTKLRYTISFENTGNDTAFNIYIMDTLSDDVDILSYDIIGASAPMFFTKMKDGSGRNILRFDFPEINLLDSSRHGLCDGLVSFTINSKPGLPDCEHIYNRAGIYFDVNDVVMTNTVENIIGCWPAISGILQPVGLNPTIYPNPANDILNIEADINHFHSLTISNHIGTKLITRNITKPITQVDIQTLPAGFYFIELTRDEGNVVRKFVKM